MAWKLTIGLLLACAAMFAYHKRHKAETALPGSDRHAGETAPLVEPLLLPLFLVILVLMVGLLGNWMLAGTTLLAYGAALFLYLSVYYAILLCVLPLLRRLISPNACAALWLVPNFLYYTIYLGSGKQTPLLALTLPRRWLQFLAPVWIGGFAVVLLWQIISHLRYRRTLLQDAAPVQDGEILAQWEYEQKRGNAKHSIPLVVSKQAHTPLTIGCFSRTMRLVLPHTNYTPEELELIFRHELHHIQRADTRSKALLGFFAALCWFNPLIWIARRKVSEDLELSCDELVLCHADEPTRQQYADLLLRTAGSSTGYTTCLSAAASALRYRLKNVVKPQKRLSGAMAVGVALFLLMLLPGTLALTDSPDTVEELIFTQAPAGIAIDNVSMYQTWDDGITGYRVIYDWQEEALTDYLASLTVKQVYLGDYPDGKRQLYVNYAEIVDGAEQSLTRFELCDGVLFADIPYDNFGELTFLLETDVDWNYIESLLDFDAPNPDPAPQPPQMMMDFNDDVTQLMYAESTVLRWEQGGVVQEVGEWMLNAGVGGVSGFPVTQVHLSFSYAPIQNTYSIQVENWDRTDSYIVQSFDLTDNILELAPYSAHYTVSGTFHTVRDTTYEMEFYFDVELP